MGFKQAFLASSVLATLVSAQSQLWGQCGGTGWSGSTTCVSGSTCTFSNPWYSQCLPGSAAPSSSTTTTTQRQTTTSQRPTTTLIVPTTSIIPTTSLVVTTASTTLIQTTTSAFTTSIRPSSTTTASASPSPSSSSKAILWATHYDGTLSTLTFTVSGSAYSLVSSAKQTTCGTQPSWLTYDATTSTLYCLDEYYISGQLFSYAVGSTGIPSQTSVATTVANGLHSTLYGGASGKSYIAIAHYGASSLSTFALPISSSSRALQSFKFTMSQRGPVPSRQDAPHPHEALLDPTGAFILLPDLGADIIRIYSVARNTGALTSCANYTAAPGSGPRHGAFFVPNAGTTAGTTLYIGNELANTISSFAVTYTGSCLSLSLTKTIAPYPNGQIPAATTRNGVKVGEVRIAGNTLLTSNRADNSFGSNLDSIAQFDINPSTGEFTFNKITSTFGSYPRTFVVNKAGTFVAIGNQNSGSVAIVKRDPATGALGELVASASVGPTGNDGNGGMNSVTWME